MHGFCAEMSVLEGAKTTLTRWRPFIAFEHGIAAREWYGVESVDLFESLSDLGYIIIDMDFMRHTRATFQETRLWNFLALPDARLLRTDERIGRREDDAYQMAAVYRV